MRIFRGRLEPCNDNLGGVKYVYLFGYSQEVAERAVIKRGVSLTSYPSTLVYKFEIKDGNFTENFTEGLGGWSQSLSFTLAKQTFDDALLLDRLQRMELGVIIQEQNGTFRLMGAENGCYIDNNAASSGGSKSDFNGYTISITANERYKSPQILDFDNSGFAFENLAFLVNNFRDRVIAGGGEFEARQCLFDTLQELEITDPIAILSNSFNNIVLADGGEFESKQCLFDTLQEIKSL